MVFVSEITGKRLKPNDLGREATVSEITEKLVSKQAEFWHLSCRNPGVAVALSAENHT